jgi:hypothetical protein
LIDNIYDDEATHQSKMAKVLEAEKAKTGKDQLMKTMGVGIGKNTALFDMKTGTIIAHYLCLRIIRSRQSLRNSATTRNDYYFY